MTFAAQDAAIAAGTKATPRGVAIPSRDAGRYLTARRRIMGGAPSAPAHQARIGSRGGFDLAFARRIDWNEKSARDGIIHQRHAVKASHSERNDQ